MANLATLSNTYGASNCSLLQLHSGGSGGGSKAADAVPASVFQACRHANLPGGGAGGCTAACSTVPGHVCKPQVLATHGN
jgi:hypothetical protein